MRIAFWLRVAAALVPLSLAAASPAAEKQDELSQELLVTLDHNQGMGITYSRAPRVAVFRDGRVIFAKYLRDEREETYFTTRMTPKELQALEATLANLTKTEDDSINLAPGWHDLPSVTLSLYQMGKARDIFAYGYSTRSETGRDEVHDTNEKPDDLPESFHRTVKILLAIDPQEVAEWKPEYIDARVTVPYEAPLLFRDFERDRRVPTEWPEKWPKVDDRTSFRLTAEFTSQESYSIIVPGEDLPQLMKLERDRSKVRIDGKDWDLYYWIPLLPGTERWQLLQKALGKN